MKYAFNLALIVKVLAILGALYQLALVIYPYFLHGVPIFDYTQLVRATHIFFLLIVGYLRLAAIPLQYRFRLSGIVLYLLTLPFLFELFYILPLPLFVSAVAVWLLAFMPVCIRYVAAALGVAALAPYIYIVVNYQELIYRAITPYPLDVLMGWIELLLVAGLVYRFIGPVLPGLVYVFMLYTRYGSSLPGQWASPGLPLDLIIAKIYIETEAALWGIVTNGSDMYIAYFMIFTALLAALGFGEEVARIAMKFIGKRPWGVGNAVVAAGVMMGMVSGSGAADTAFIGGTFKDLFKRAGYSPYVAAGLVANAGTLAIITPPIMGSAAFIMVEILGIPYLWVIVMAIVPALLYAWSIASYNRYYAKAANLRPVEVEVSGLKYYVFAPIALIVALIALGFSVRLSVTVAIFFTIGMALALPSFRPRATRIWSGLAEGILSLAPIGTSIAMANVMMSMVVLSGLANTFSQALLNIVANNLLVAILFASVFTLIISLGMTPTAAYVLSSVLLAPALIKLAEVSGVPTIVATLATHMFLFYYAMMADIDPFTGLSTYAAAGVFGLRPIRVGIRAISVAAAKYFFPPLSLISYNAAAIYVLPILLTSPPLTAAYLIGVRVAAVAAGVWLLSIANAGFYRKPLPLVARLIIAALGIAMIIPNELVNLASFALALAILRLRY